MPLFWSHRITPGKFPGQDGQRETRVEFIDAGFMLPLANLLLVVKVSFLTVFRKYRITRLGDMS